MKQQPTIAEQFVGLALCALILVGFALIVVATL